MNIFPMSFKKWWSNNMNLGHVITKSLKGTDFEGMSFGQLLGNILGLATRKILDTEMTGGQEQRAQTELENQQLLNEEEYDRKIDFYERFESPEALVRQYKSAGLNPALMFGNGASVSASGGIGSAGSVSQASAAGSQSPFSGAMSSVLGLMQFGLDAKVARAGIDQKRADTDSVKAATAAQLIENEYKRQLNDLEIAKRKQDLNLGETQINLNIKELEKLGFDTEVARAYSIFAPTLFQKQIELNDSSAVLNDARAYRERVEASLSEERKKEIASIVSRNNAESRVLNETIKKINAEIGLLNSQADLTDQQKMESIARVKNLQQEYTLLGKKIGLSQLEIDWYAANHTEVIAYDEGAAVSTVTYKDQSGVFMKSSSKDNTYKRIPYSPGGAN